MGRHLRALGALVALVACGRSEGPSDGPPTPAVPDAAPNIPAEPTPAPPTPSAPPTPAPADAPAPPVPAAPAPFQGVELVPEQGNLHGLLQEEYSYAANRGWVTHVQVYADWCAPCRAVRESSAHPAVANALQDVWLVRLQADAWRDALAGSGYEGADIPRFHEVGPDGRPTGRKVTGEAWGADTPENIGPALDAYFHPK